MEKKGLSINFNIETKEFEFWKKYFQIYNLNQEKENKFTEFELDSIALILSGDYYKSPLKGKQRKNLINNLNTLGYKITSQNVHTRVITPLLKHGVLYKSEDDDGPGEYTIMKKLKTIQQYTKHHLEKNIPIEISVNFNMTITNGRA